MTNQRLNVTKETYLAALRSSDYAQTRGQLVGKVRDWSRPLAEPRDCFCADGLLAELSTNVKRVEVPGGLTAYAFDDDKEGAPSIVGFVYSARQPEWLALASISLSEMNDSRGLTFSQIADEIEYELRRTS